MDSNAKYLFIDNELECAWVTRAQQGEHHAFERLLQHYRGYLFNYLLKLNKDHDVIDDLIQETWIKVYKSIIQFRGDGSFRGWLCMIARNTWKNYLRSEHYERYDYTVDVYQHDIAADNQIDEQAILTEEKERLYNAITQLPVKQREAVHLRINEQLSFNSIAKLMQCSVSTAKSNHYYGIRSVQQMLAA